MAKGVQNALAHELPYSTEYLALLVYLLYSVCLLRNHNDNWGSAPHKFKTDPSHFQVLRTGALAITLHTSIYDYLPRGRYPILRPCEYLKVEQQLLSVFCRQSTDRDPRCSLAAGHLPAHYRTHSLITKSPTKREANEGPSKGRKDHRRCFSHCPNYSAKVAYIHRSFAFSLSVRQNSFPCLSSDSPSFCSYRKGKGSEEQGLYQKQSGLR